MASSFYPAAIVVMVTSVFLTLLIIPPMLWHHHNHNLAATILIAWVLIMNAQILVNAALWPNDDIDTWYNGVGLCDIEVKIQVAASVAVPASFSCVLRALARVLDTDRAVISLTRAQRRRACAIDLLCCIGAPLLQMPLHYIVQTNRYYLYGITGCVPAVDNSWLMVILMLGPQLLWSVVCFYYAVLIIIRIMRYRQAFESILANSNTDKSRFVRLCVFCLLYILGCIPMQVFNFIPNLDYKRVPYSWSQVHDPKVWNEVPMVPSHGHVLYNVYTWLALGAAVFLFFGFGVEAARMYRHGCRVLGLNKLCPAAWRGRGSSLTVSPLASIGSKARMMFKHKSMTGSSVATDSTMLSQGSMPSPKQVEALNDRTAGGRSRLSRLSPSMDDFALDVVTGRHPMPTGVDEKKADGHEAKALTELYEGT